MWKGIKNGWHVLRTSALSMAPSVRVGILRSKGACVTGYLVSRSQCDCHPQRKGILSRCLFFLFFFFHGRCFSLSRCFELEDPLFFSCQGLSCVHERVIQTFAHSGCRAGMFAGAWRVSSKPTNGWTAFLLFSSSSPSKQLVWKYGSGSHQACQQTPGHVQQPRFVKNFFSFCVEADLWRAGGELDMPQLVVVCGILFRVFILLRISRRGYGIGGQSIGGKIERPRNVCYILGKLYNTNRVTESSDATFFLEDRESSLDDRLYSNSSTLPFQQNPPRTPRHIQNGLSSCI